VSSRPSGQQLKTPEAVNVEPETRYRQVGDGWRNADAGACQHWRPGCSAPTDTVVRGRLDTGELSLLASILLRSSTVETDVVRE